MANWTQRGAVLTASDAKSGDNFGFRVATNAAATALAVTAAFWNTSLDSIAGVYVLTWNGSTWVQRGSVLSPSTYSYPTVHSNDYQYGYGVAITADGATVAIGSGQWGTGAAQYGGVYIHDWDGSAWVQRGGVLSAADAEDGDGFGYGVAISGDGLVLAVGAPLWDGAAANQGGVYIYDWSGSAWIQRGSVITASDAASGDQFGYAVGLSADGTCLVVGAPFWEGTTTNQGGVYVLIWDGAAWVQRGAVVFASDPLATDLYAQAVSINGNGTRIAVGAAQWEGAITNMGQTYVYDWNGSSWAAGSNITAGDAAANDLFGNAALASSGPAVVGAYAWEGALSNQGGVYVFDYTPPPVGSGAMGYSPAMEGAATFFEGGFGFTGSGAMAYSPTLAAVADSRHYPITITVLAPGEVVRHPIRIHVGTAETRRYPLTITVLAPAVVGGLDGAGGWAAAPDGRWQATLLLDGVDRSAWLVGPLRVARKENAAATAEFALRLAGGTQPMDLIGREVRLAFAQRGPAGEVINAQLVFMGVIDHPELDMPGRRVQCLCTDRLQEVVSALPRDWIDTHVGGRHAEEISGVAEDSWQYCLERLASVPKSIALDVLGSPTLVPWRPAGTPLRVARADFLDGDPRVRLPSRSEMRTRITCTVEYRYQALRNRGITSAWRRDHRFFIYGADGTNGPLHWLTKEMVEGAFKGLSSWELLSLHIESPRADTYAVGVGIDAGSYTISPEVAPSLAVGWNARLRNRWHQSRTEKLTMVVVAPNLETLLGQPVAEEMGASVTAPDPDPAWHANRKTAPRFGTIALEPVTDPDTMLAAPVGDTVVPFEPMVDGDTARAAFDNAALTMLDRARVRLWAASRSGAVTVRLPCRPDIWLGRRVEVDDVRDDGGLHAIGDLVGITHTLDPDSGEATTEWEIAVGLPGNADSAAPTWTPPAVTYPEDDPANAPPSSLLSAGHDYFIGGLPSSPAFDEDNMIGLVTNLDTEAVFLSDADKAARHWYPLQLTIRTPEIPEADRDPLELPATAEYTWDVPTDLLEIA